MCSYGCRAAQAPVTVSTANRTLIFNDASEGKVSVILYQELALCTWLLLLLHHDDRGADDNKCCVY